MTWYTNRAPQRSNAHFADEMDADLFHLQQQAERMSANANGAVVRQRWEDIAHLLARARVPARAMMDEKRRAETAVH